MQSASIILFDKIKNPKAGAPQIGLALVYIALFAALFVGAMVWQFAYRAPDVGIAEKLPF